MMKTIYKRDVMTVNCQKVLEVNFYEKMVT